MSPESVDPAVRALLEEAAHLPDCAARDALYQRAAVCAEALGDLRSAWDARCAILASNESYAAPRFENLFLCLAWCLAVSDRDPTRFHPGRILWQYKWVIGEAPGYARIPRDVLEGMVNDLAERFVRAGWGRRAGLHQRVELALELGEPVRALEQVDAWRAAPRDRGSDCIACEASSVVGLLVEAGEHDRAVREARPIIHGRLSCGTVPHGTFGALLTSLTLLGRDDEARRCYDRGRRLVAAMLAGGASRIAPYLLYAAWIGDVEQAQSMLRARLAQMAAQASDRARVHALGQVAVALELLGARAVEPFELPAVPGLVDAPTVDLPAVAHACRQTARAHAEALDLRNGNRYYAGWLTGLSANWAAR